MLGSARGKGQASCCAPQMHEEQDMPGQTEIAHSNSTGSQSRTAILNTVCNTNYESTTQQLNVIAENKVVEPVDSMAQISRSVHFATLSAAQRNAWAQRSHQQSLAFRARSTAGPF